MKTFAYFDSSHEFPEEIIIAAQMNPYKILGKNDFSTELADQYIPQFMCANARSFLNQALEESSKWEGIAIAHGCDATNRQFDIWEQHVQTPFLYYIHNPLRTDRIAQRFFIREIKAMINALESKYRIKITLDQLEKAIQVSNNIKILLQSLSQLRIIKDISNSEYFNVVKYCVQNPKEEIISYLNSILSDWKTRNSFPINKIPIFLTGSDITHALWYELLEKVNLRVVRDDLTIGERYFATLIPTDKDPISNIAKYYLNIPRSSTKHPTNPRINYILKACKSEKIHGVVSQIIKYCETFAYDVPFLKSQLEVIHIPVIHVEREFTENIDQQISTRLEAFVELLEQNR
ncbi:2-hydroxyacyl-CoA dehydratase family protein [Promethearchaeum syntrophicum]|uniref:2-hydroxyacyl-CoA dehydratase family protein n=1 Tax=Promethearchaeum syntrophicum TaxID=2594042 RepID=A0A5B9DBN1_9ARCH|nr:2-hydroxyacyl-CoA dehydratase family protein [Candidatus Prometheoarchaeum syntrophicum]QEE16588.1 2-hydroxyglutaryl-CoA dehydratase, D-component [Candidatus Prometheoarchaeum syntrophicum]